MIQNRYSLLTNESDHDNIVKDVQTTDKGGSRKTRQRFSMKRKGRIQIKDHVVFEAIRKATGGGTLISGHKNLNPKLIEQYEEDFELLVVEIELKQKKVRVISGYGPQENWPEERRRPFFSWHWKPRLKKQHLLINLSS